MSKRILLASMAALIALGLHLTPASAQTTPPTKRELQRSIEDLTQLDPDIERYLPRWRVTEADLKIKLAQYFKMKGIAVSEADSMVATAAFPDPKTGNQELLSIRAGSSPDAVLSGTDKIRSDLGEALYQRILSRDYAHAIIEPALPQTERVKERIPNVLQPNNATQFIALSAFRQVVQLGTTGARLEHMLGNDEIGYHFWTSGQGKATLTYPIIPLEDPELRAVGVPDILTISLGVGYRMRFGSQGNTFLEDVIAPRKLNGAIGTKAIAEVEYRLPQVNDLGLTVYTEVPFSKLNGIEEVRVDESIAWEPVPVGVRPTVMVKGGYFLRTIAQGGIFWENWLNDYEHFFRITLGVSYQEISQALLLSGGETIPVEDDVIGDAVQHIDLSHPTEFEDWLLARVEYLNQSGFPFGATVQLANRNLLVTGFIPVLRNWLFLEAKYSMPVLRDEPAPWEHRSFFMISPILRFELDSQ